MLDSASIPPSTPVPVICDAPQPPVNGSINGQPSYPLVGSKVTYHCDDGLFPTGVMTSTCTDVGGRGEWVTDPAQLMCRVPGNFMLSSVTVCSAISFFHAVSCKTPVEPLHGYIVGYHNLTTTEGSMITFQCELGFSPAAEMTATCNSSGQWSTDPSQLVCTCYGK